MLIENMWHRWFIFIIMQEKVILVTVSVLDVSVFKTCLIRWKNGLFTLQMFIIINGFLFII